MCEGSTETFEGRLMYEPKAGALPSILTSSIMNALAIGI